MSSLPVSRKAVTVALLASWACTPASSWNAVATQDETSSAVLRDTERCSITWFVSSEPSEPNKGGSLGQFLTLSGTKFFRGWSDSDPDVREFPVEREELERVVRSLDERGFFSEAEVGRSSRRPAPPPRLTDPGRSRPNVLDIRLTCSRRGTHRSWTVQKRGELALRELHAAHAIVDPYFAALIWDLVEAWSEQTGTEFIAQAFGCERNDSTCQTDAGALTDCHGAPIPLEHLQCTDDTDCSTASGMCRLPIAVRSDRATVVHRRLLQGCGSLSCAQPDEAPARVPTCVSGICRLRAAVPTVSPTARCPGSGTSVSVTVEGTLPK